MARPRKYDRQRVLELAAAGVISEEIAKQVGCSPCTVSRIIKAETGGGVFAYRMNQLRKAAV